MRYVAFSFIWSSSLRTKLKMLVILVVNNILNTRENLEFKPSVHLLHVNTSNELIQQTNYSLTILRQWRSSITLVSTQENAICRLFGIPITKHGSRLLLARLSDRRLLKARNEKILKCECGVFLKKPYRACLDAHMCFSHFRHIHGDPVSPHACLGRIVHLVWFLHALPKRPIYVWLPTLVSRSTDANHMFLVMCIGCSAHLFQMW